MQAITDPAVNTLVMKMQLKLVKNPLHGIQILESSRALVTDAIAS